MQPTVVQESEMLQHVSRYMDKGEKYETTHVCNLSKGR